MLILNIVTYKITFLLCKKLAQIYKLMLEFLEKVLDKSKFKKYFERKKIVTC